MAPVGPQVQMPGFAVPPVAASHDEPTSPGVPLISPYEQSLSVLEAKVTQKMDDLSAQVAGLETTVKGVAESVNHAVDAMAPPPPALRPSLATGRPSARGSCSIRAWPSSVQPPATQTHDDACK